MSVNEQKKKHTRCPNGALAHRLGSSCYGGLWLGCGMWVVVVVECGWWAVMVVIRGVGCRHVAVVINEINA